jgi:hypothetical protein
MRVHGFHDSGVVLCLGFLNLRCPKLSHVSADFVVNAYAAAVM